MPDDFLVADNLHKSFGALTAVDDVSFTVRRQEIFGLLGPHDAGKTTLVRMLSTVLLPDAGDAIIGGRSIRSEPGWVRRLIGVCPQAPALFDDISAMDNLVFFGRMSGLTGGAAKERAKQQLEVVDLADHASTRVSKLSIGMKRLLSLAVGLMSDPLLLLVDHPTVGTDRESRDLLFRTLWELRQDGLTVLYATSYLEEADYLCNRVAMMDHGQIVAMGTPQDLKARASAPSGATLDQVFLHLAGRSVAV